MAGSTVLYHINKHPDLFPKPQKSRYSSSFRNIPEKVIWLTPNYYEVMDNHGIFGNVHAFQVDNGVIEEAGGIKQFDHAMEIMFDPHLWNQNLGNGKIKYLGKVSQDKLPRRQITRPQAQEKKSLRWPGEKNREHPIYKQIQRLCEKDYISWETGDTLTNEFREYIKSKNTEGLQALEDKIEYYYKHPEPDVIENRWGKRRPSKITAFNAELAKEVYRLNDKIRQSLLPQEIKDKLSLISGEISQLFEKEIKPSDIQKTYSEIKGIIANLKVQLAKELENELSFSEYINRTAKFATVFCDTTKTSNK